MKKSTSLALATLLATGVAIGVAEAAAAQKPLSTCGMLSQGSYRLIRNLMTTGSCLTLLQDFITVDLNGFVIMGDRGLEEGQDFGVQTGAVETLTGIEIRNGTIANFSRGINLPFATGVLVERVRVLRSSNVGILPGGNCVLKDNIVAESANSGIISGSGCVATGNNATNNSTGLIIQEGSVAIGNVARNNRDDGIHARAGSIVTNNSASSNDGFGITAVCPSNVIGNTAIDNIKGNYNLVGVGCGNNFNVGP